MMNTTERKKGSRITLLLNCLGAVMMVFALFSIYNSNKYIQGLIVQGFEPSKQMVQVINYYITTVTPYIFYGICIFVLAYIVKQLEKIIIDSTNLSVNQSPKVKIIDTDIEEEEDIVDALLSEEQNKKELY